MLALDFIVEVDKQIKNDHMSKLLKLRWEVNLREDFIEVAKNKQELIQNSTYHAF